MVVESQAISLRRLRSARARAVQRQRSPERSRFDPGTAPLILSVTRLAAKTEVIFVPQGRTTALQCTYPEALARARCGMPINQRCHVWAIPAIDLRGQLTALEKYADPSSRLKEIAHLVEQV